MGAPSNSDKKAINPFKGKYDLVNLERGKIKFGFLYKKDHLWVRFLVAIAVGLILAVVTQFLIKNTGLYNSGLSGVLQGIARCVYTSLSLKSTYDPETNELIFNIMFWGFLLVANIPLFIFGYFKIGKMFSLLTLVFLITNTLFGLALSYIPRINDIYLLGNTVPMGYPMPNDYVGDATYNIFSEQNINIIPFWYDTSWIHDMRVAGPSEGDITTTFLAQNIFNNHYDPYKSFFLILYAIFYGLVMSFAYSALYIVGGCSAGMDFVSIYYSSIKHKNLGGILIMINGGCLILGTIIGTYIPAGLTTLNWTWTLDPNLPANVNPDIIVDPGTMTSIEHPYGYAGFSPSFLFSANLVASFLSVVLFGILLNSFFPLNKAVKIEIISDKTEQIKEHLYKHNYTHSLSISQHKGAYSQLSKTVLWTVCLYIETPKLFTLIKEIDPEALTIGTPIDDISGKFKIYRQGSTEK